ncbi:MAG: MATE family efflux transporter [Dehalococcoidia bacterium]|nr:MATE family efflux transporter [Dehalococcoidia bacterium]
MGTASYYGATVVSIVVGLISVPIGLDYFGVVRYGIWAVVSSVIAYLGLSNLGITTAAQVLTAKASAPFEQRTVLRRSLFLLLVSSAVALGAVLGTVHFYPGWVGVLGKIPADLHGEATEAAIAIAILFLLNLPLTVFSAGFVGRQKVYWERTYASLTTIAGLVALILTVFLLKGNLVTLALFTGVARLLVSIACASHFLFANSDLRQKPAEPISKEFSTNSILASGIRFFVIGVAGMVLLYTDNLVISHFLGVQMVTPYAVTFTIFNLGFSIFAAINGALSPMYSQSAGRNQWEWVQETYNHTVHLLPILGGLLWIGGIAFAREIITLWAGPQAYGGLLVVIALGGYGYTVSLVSSHVTVLIALNRTKRMVVYNWLEAVSKLGISLALVRVLGIGGAAVGTFLGDLLTVFWLLPRDVARQTAGKVNMHTRPIISHAIAAMLPCLAFVLLTYLFAPVGWMRVMINVFVVILYLALSLRIMSPDTRSLVKNILTEVYVHIKTQKVKI